MLDTTLNVKLYTFNVYPYASIIWIRSEGIISAE